MRGNHFIGRLSVSWVLANTAYRLLKWRSLWNCVAAVKRQSNLSQSARM